jgi:hypothetical protein
MRKLDKSGQNRISQTQACVGAIETHVKIENNLIGADISESDSYGDS